MFSQKKLKDVSVIIPTLNRCNFLKRALDSVLKQTIKPKNPIIEPISGYSIDGAILEFSPNLSEEV